MASSAEFHTGVSPVAIAALLLACASWSSDAVGRTQTEADCRNDVVHGLQSLDIPTEPLTIRRVDHIDLESTTPQLEPLDTEAPASDVATPFLYLTPHVANAMREIFESDVADSPVTLPSSPLAESVPADESLEIPDDAAQPVDDAAEDHLPLLKRQMYRIDI